MKSGKAICITFSRDSRISEQDFFASVAASLSKRTKVVESVSSITLTFNLYLEHNWINF